MLTILRNIYARYPSLSLTTSYLQNIARIRCMSNFVKPGETYSKSDNYSDQIKSFKAAKDRIAKMMGSDPDTFTKDDMDSALEYLLPHNIRPIPFKPRIYHPDDIRKRDKSSLNTEVLNENGRPHEPGFYTARPCYHNFRYEFNNLLRYLDTGDETYNPNYPNKYADEETTLEDLIGDDKFLWLDKENIEIIVGEIMQEWNITSIKESLISLSKHPKADHNVYSLIRQFRYPKVNVQKSVVEGKSYVHMSGISVVEETGTRKTAKAKVMMWKGEGLILVNHMSLAEYFQQFNDVLQVIYPFSVAEALGKCSAICEVHSSGSSAQAGAIRYAAAKCLAKLLPESKENLANAGLLWGDARRAEKKKPGRAKARKRYTWRKR